jgi:NADPH-dependent 2,4-dienoyl-CoA reductase/sulfur reductase-like enzyme
VTGTVLIAGAGLAGSRCAETLRALGWRGRIVLVGEEPHPPYERPALSKELLAGERDDVELRPRSFWAAHGIELHLGRHVSAVDPVRRTALVGGETLAWDAFVLATGARPRRLSSGAHHLRTLHDARRLRTSLRPDVHLLVVGAGFVGTEVASTALPFVGRVTLVDVQTLPLERVLGPEVGRVLARRYREHGVELRLGAPCDVGGDVVVAGIGAEPAGELLGGGAVDTDACGRTAAPDVYACGDVARWSGRRVEHWTSAAGQARAVAAAIAGQPVPYEEQPYFWSDQFGLRLQHVGHAERWHSVVLEGGDDAFTARYLDRDGRLLAALAANRSDAVAALRRELAA